MAWTQAIRSFLGSGTMLSMAGGMIATGTYVIYTDTARSRNMRAVYAHGNILPPLAENDFEIAYFRRPGVETLVREVLRPTFANEYFLINGDVGVGKSRLVLEVVRDLMQTEGKEGRGAPVYVLTSQGRSFPETLAQAVNFYFDEHVNFKFFLSFVMRIHSMPKHDNDSRLIRVLEAIENSAFDYMQRTGRPFVLVIDGVNDLPAMMPGALEKLQDKAKLWADANAVKVVFVNNDEETEAKMQRYSSNWSRMAAPIIIEDMTRDEAVAFLMSPAFMETEPANLRRRNEGKDEQADEPKMMSLEMAERMVELVGGRMHALIMFKRDWIDGVPYEITAGDMIDREREKFLTIQSQNPSAWKVVCLLKAAPGMSMLLSKLVKQTSHADVCALVKRNLMRYDRDNIGIMVRFRSKLTENVLKNIDSSD